MTSTITDLERGRGALRRGDWAAAGQAFEASLQMEESPEALEGLGLAAWWLDQGDAVFNARERAYRIYRERGDGLGAARVAVWLAWDTAAFRGEHAIANGWLEQAHRLLEPYPDAIEHAWLALRRGIFALLDDGEPDAAAQLASEAVRISSAICQKTTRSGEADSLPPSHQRPLLGWWLRPTIWPCEQSLRWPSRCCSASPPDSRRRCSRPRMPRPARRFPRSVSRASTN